MDGDKPPTNEDPAIITGTVNFVVTTIESYGWLLLLSAIAVYYAVSRLRPRIDSWQQQTQDAAFKKTDVNEASSRMEAMQRARERMQEQLDAQAQEFAQKQAEKEEKKRQEKIEDWDRHLEGKGYRSKVKVSDSSQSEQSNPKPKPKKPLRQDYNPLMGDASSACYRPTRRGGASGGG